MKRVIVLSFLALIASLGLIAKAEAAPCVKHQTQIVGVDNPLFPISKDEWNACHDVSFMLNAAGNITGSGVIDWSLGVMQTLTLTGDATLTLNNPIVGTRYVLVVLQDGTGGRVITWPAAVRFPVNSANQVNGEASTLTVVHLDWDGTNYNGFIPLPPYTEVDDLNAVAGRGDKTTKHHNSFANAFKIEDGTNCGTAIYTHGGTDPRVSSYCGGIEDDINKHVKLKPGRHWCVENNAGNCIIRVDENGALIGFGSSGSGGGGLQPMRLEATGPTGFAYTTPVYGSSYTWAAVRHVDNQSALSTWSTKAQKAGTQVKVIIHHKAESGGGGNVSLQFNCKAIGNGAPMDGSGSYMFGASGNPDEIAVNTSANLTITTLVASGSLTVAQGDHIQCNMVRIGADANDGLNTGWDLQAVWFEVL